MRAPRTVPRLDKSRVVTMGWSFSKLVLLMDLMWGCLIMLD